MSEAMKSLELANGRTGKRYQVLIPKIRLAHIIDSETSGIDVGGADIIDGKNAYSHQRSQRCWLKGRK